MQPLREKRHDYLRQVRGTLHIDIASTGAGSNIGEQLIRALSIRVGHVKGQPERVDRNAQRTQLWQRPLNFVNLIHAREHLRIRATIGHNDDARPARCMLQKPGSLLQSRSQRRISFNRISL
jgi:hypothetical protein